MLLEGTCKVGEGGDKESGTGGSTPLATVLETKVHQPERLSWCRGVQSSPRPHQRASWGRGGEPNAPGTAWRCEGPPPVHVHQTVQ